MVQAKDEKPISQIDLLYAPGSVVHANINDHHCRVEILANHTCIFVSDSEIAKCCEGAGSLLKKRKFEQAFESPNEKTSDIFPQIVKIQDTLFKQFDTFSSKHV